MNHSDDVKLSVHSEDKRNVVSGILHNALKVCGITLPQPFEGTVYVAQL
jgi:hypothetical protein